MTTEIENCRKHDPKKIRVCSMDDCNDVYHARGFCRKHYLKGIRAGSIKKERSCKLKTCTNPHYSKGYCQLHYQQNKHLGIVAEIGFSNGKNPILKLKDYAKVKLFNTDRKFTGYFLIDLDDVSLFEGRYCSVSLSGYVVTYIRKGQLLHGKHKLIPANHLIIKPKKGHVVIHKNDDRLDLRKGNLMQVSHSESGVQRKIYKNNTTGVKGVSYHKSLKQFSAGLTYNKIEKRKYFNTLEDAVTQRKAWEAELSHLPKISR